VLGQVDDGLVEAELAIEALHAFAAAIEHVDAAAVVGGERHGLDTALVQLGRDRQMHAVRLQRSDRGLVAAIGDEHVAAGQPQHRDRPRERTRERARRVAHEHAIGAKTLDAAAQSVGDEHTFGIGPDRPRRAEVRLDVASGMQPPQRGPGSRESLHRAPPRLVAGADQHGVADHGHRVRPIEHTGAIARDVAVAWSRRADVAEMATERAEVADAVVVRIGDEQVEVLVHGHASRVRVTLAAGRNRPRGHSLARFEIEQEHMPQRRGPRHTQKIAAHRDTTRHRRMILRGSIAAKVRLAAALCGAVLLASCSTLPDSRFPDFEEHNVAAEFLVPSAGRLRLPSSTRSLVVQELSLDPSPEAEMFDSKGERWLVYPAGTAVHVRCRFRAYAQNGGKVPSPAEVLAGARDIKDLQEP
jgi:hypothetical protein